MSDIIGKQEPELAAPEKGPGSKDLPCRYFKKGFCGLDEKCPYRHNPPKSSSSDNASEAANCCFYKQSACKFASKCWYKHIGPNGKVYPRPDPLNKFIVLGPASKEPDATEDNPTPVEKSGTSAGIHKQKPVIRRSFRKPVNRNVSKNCFHYEEKGNCYYGDKCWYSHSKPHEDTADELPPEPTLEPEQDPDLNRKMCLNFSFMECDGNCDYVHGDICQFCNRPFLHPFNKKQRNDHLEACKRYVRLADELPPEPTLEAEPGPTLEAEPEPTLEAEPEPYAYPTDEVPPEPTLEPDPNYKKLCLNFSFLECKLGDKCAYAHGHICQVCDLPLMHPSDKEQRDKHFEECKELFENDMDIANIIAISKDKKCHICMDFVWEPEKLFTKQKFGIQEKCNHIYCLDCIRRWRDVKRKNNEPQHCPACRQESFVILPSATWFKYPEEKIEWIESYKAAMKKIPCKFWARGKCRNKGNCNYDHEKVKKKSYLIENQDQDEDDLWGLLATEVIDH